MFSRWRRPKINQLEHNNLADDEDQLLVLKCEANQLNQVLRSLLKNKKKIQVISTADESVSSRKDISTVDESINSHYSRRRKEAIISTADESISSRVYKYC
ncbi:hypothetical protein F511_10523 [Dorcoceras hygrometricum]|uniref:Uncharacterized protein n=1 Tax=Dorcoceras hygrometricum TaxID=472368 RepID=A0A2Z7AE19_9LAMI|nr:hypothetical protein F511_10523 [Dorcoceras hygrometricum]